MTNKELVGTWISEVSDWNTGIVITESLDGRLSVSSYDSRDGELFEVSNLVVSEDFLEFDKRVPSTGYRNHIRLTVDDDGSLRGALTIFERWIKTS